MMASTPLIFPLRLSHTASVTAAREKEKIIKT
jgi:hypothetical protein